MGDEDFMGAIAGNRFRLVAFLTVCFLLLEVGGCSDATAIDVTGGQSSDPTSNVAGSPDAYESPRRMTPDAAQHLADARSIIDAGGGDGGTGGGGDEAACFACLQQRCRVIAPIDPITDWYANCFLNTDLAMEGDGAGMTKAVLCQAVVHCTLATACPGARDYQDCYCGAASDIDCLGVGRSSGACKQEIEVAAETRDPGVIATEFVDPGRALGAAVDMLTFCVLHPDENLGPGVPSCEAACLGGGSPRPDAGPGPDAPTVSIPDGPLQVPDGPPIPAGDAGVTACADLDSDGTPDCDETLLQNARFDTDVGSWTAMFGATQSFSGSLDGLGGSSSGSIAVTNAVHADIGGMTMVGSSQCVPATAGAVYTVAAQVFLPPGQGTGEGAVNVQFFSSASCAGTNTGSFTSSLVAQTGIWTVVSGSTTAPANARSVLVRLVVQKPFSAPPFEANFDNVLLEAP